MAPQLHPAPVPEDIQSIDDLTPAWQVKHRCLKVAAKRGVGIFAPVTQLTCSFDIDRPNTWSAEQKVAVFDLILSAGQHEIEDTDSSFRNKYHPKYLVHAELIDKHVLLIDRLMGGLVCHR